MDPAVPPPLTVVRPGEGRVVDLGDGFGVVFELWGEDTDGAMAVVEHPEPHAMWNAGPAPARMVEIISPAGFEGFSRDAADLAEAGTTVVPAFLALADAYGLRPGDPGWEAEVVRRHGPTAPS